MASPVTVDFHAHAQSPKAAELIASAANNPGADANAHNQHLFATQYRAAFSDIAVRMQTMDRQRIDMQVVSPAPNYAYWADEETSPRIAAASNEHVAEVCAKDPDRLVGLGHVSLQFPAIAAQQVGTILDALRLKGIEIGTRAEGVDLDDPSLDPFWSAVESRNAPVFIHPAGTTLGQRVAKYYLGNIIGNPLDTTIALTNLIFGGVLERFPNLHIVAAHGGGYLPSYFSRSTHGYQVRPEAREQVAHPPLHYLRKITVDNLVYEPEFVAHLVNVVGASNVVLGTDYPFDMGQDNPVDLVDALGLSADDARRIKSENALRLLGMVS